MGTLEIGNRQLSLNDLYNVVYAGYQVKLSTEPDFVARIQASVDYLRKALANHQPIYGTTTGFGASCTQYLNHKKAALLQQNLIRYHRCATGEYLSKEQVLAIMLARLNSLAQGYSAVRLAILETLCQMINAQIIPLIPAQGSVGASGDLTPLAYVAAAMQGDPTLQVTWQGQTFSAQEALEKAQIPTVAFQAKEGLAVINGTSVMAGILAISCLHIDNLIQAMEQNTALAVQVLLGKREAFHPAIHLVKPFKGQKSSAANIFRLLQDSQLLRDHLVELSSYIKEKEKEENAFELPFAVQDVYSLRCSPHVIGVLRDNLEQAVEWLETELNSVTDNPLVFPKEENILLGGNFYGGYIAQAADSLKIALASAVDLSERQLALIVDPKFSQGLPGNLVHHPSEPEVHHGFKGMQITASALVAETLKNATPASIFSRVTESCNQDKVSMGTIATRDLQYSVILASRILAILSLANAQAADIRGTERLSPASQKFYQKVRTWSAPLTEDRPMDQEIEELAQQLLHLSKGGGT